MEITVPCLEKYKLDYDSKGSVVIEINSDIVNEKIMTSINQFFLDHEDRVDENGSSFNGVLKMLGALVLSLSVEYDYNTSGIVSLFDYDKSGIEGWPKMDGSSGFKIISVENNLFDASDFTVSRVS